MYNETPQSRTMSVRKESKMVNAVEVWFCPGCEGWKLPAEFYSSKHSANGLSSYCRTCHNKLVRNYQKGQVKLRKKEQAELARLRAKLQPA